MGHRSLPASLPSSAWVLATSTAAGPGGPEHTIWARGEEGTRGGGFADWEAAEEASADTRAESRGGGSAPSLLQSPLPSALTRGTERALGAAPVDGPSQGGRRCGDSVTPGLADAACL